MSRPLPAPSLLAAPLALVALAGLLASGCGSPPPAAPALNVVGMHRSGGPLGSLWEGVALDPDPAAALALGIEWRWLPGEPDDELLPVGVHALAVAGTGGDAPFTAAPLIVGSVRVALGEPARAVAQRLRDPLTQVSVPLLFQDEALPVGVTAVLAPGPLALELSRSDATSGVELSLLSEGSVTLGAVREADAAPSEEGETDESADEGAAEARRRADSSRPVEWREIVLLDTKLLPGGPPAVIALPGGASGGTLVALIEVRAAPLEGQALAQHAARLARCLEDVVASTAQQAQRAAAVDAAESKHRQLIAAARSMASAGERLRAGVFLASEAGATLTLDTLLVIDPVSLEELAAAWRRASGSDDERLVQDDTLAWTLERTTALWLCQRAEAATLSAELEAVLLRQTGVVGRAPGLLQQFVEESGGVATWRELLEAENRLALEDNLPASRVRAYDWLAARDLAPKGYDPLAPRAERQAALLAADEAL